METIDGIDFFNRIEDMGITKNYKKKIFWVIFFNTFDYENKPNLESLHYELPKKYI